MKKQKFSTFNKVYSRYLKFQIFLSLSLVPTPSKSLILNLMLAYSSDASHQNKMTRVLAELFLFDL